MQLRRRRRVRSAPLRGGAVLGGLALAAWSAVQAGQPWEELAATTLAVRAGAQPAPGAALADETPCERALAVGKAASSPAHDRWRIAAEAGRPLRDLRRLAAVARTGALAAFDGVEVSETELQGSDTEPTCLQERAELEQWLAEAVSEAFLAQRRLLEEEVARALSQRLQAGVLRRGGPLRVQEKLALLREALVAYRAGVVRLRPGAVATDLQQQDEEEAVERRLREAQFAFEASPEGRAVLGELHERRARKLLGTRAHGVALSVEPGLRLLARPEGLGNLQFFSEGPVGPPSSIATMNVGLVNDGSIADVYREHPTPPKFSVQPAVKVNVQLR